ncbi:MAG: radical SAM protein [Deltaproteobacteria bacterium]|nr:radical SAM protein [Deltaproteobacteria bacterium]
MKTTAPFHPCMNHDAHSRVARLHLPVAPRCNIQCRFCSRKVTPHDTSTHCPGRAERILTPGQALEKARNFMEQWGRDAIIGIAGPGDPLANAETFETLALIHGAFPGANICLCTNGLLLPDTLGQLRALELRHLSLTVNGVSPDIVQHITPWIEYNGRRIRGADGAAILIDHQMNGIRAASGAGMFVKVNTVVVPRVNDHHVPAVAAAVQAAGAHLFNPVPLIPGGSLSSHSRPGCEDMNRIREECRGSLPVFELCKQCRADAEGIPGREACA